MAVHIFYDEILFVLFILALLTEFADGWILFIVIPIFLNHIILEYDFGLIGGEHFKGLIDSYAQ